MAVLTAPISYESTDNVYIGDWPVVHVIVDPLGAATRLSLGAVYEGVARTSRARRLTSAPTPAVRH